MPKGRVYKTKAKGAQEAHESIRPDVASSATRTRSRAWSRTTSSGCTA